MSVRVLTLSGSGCVIESRRPVEPGTSGVLRISVGGRAYQDEVQIVRCRALAGAGDRYRLSVEFLWVTQPRDDSLRSMVASMKAAGSVEGLRIVADLCE